MQTKSRKFLSVLLTLLMMAGVIAVAPVMASAADGMATIDISALGGTDANNSAAVATESQWRYVDAGKRLFLDTENGNYTLTGTNANLCVQVSFANTNVTLNGVSITAPSGGSAFVPNAAGCTVTLIGSNTFSSSDRSSINTSDDTDCTITSSSGGSLTVNAINFANGFNLNITGNAAVTSYGTNGNWGLSMSSAYTNSILIGDNAKLAFGNDSSYETRTFGKADAAATHKWKLTNATLASGALTDASISVEVAAGATGTIEREAIVTPVAPAISGPTEMKVLAGYAATSSGAYTLSGTPAPTVTIDNNHGGKITWDATNKKLDIAAGLAAGEYTVVLTASNGVGTAKTATFKLTVAKTIFSTKHESNFWNWLLFFLGFGFIWMWFI